MEYASNQVSHIYMRTDKPPFSDVRVRRAVSLAFNRQSNIDALYEGVGVFNPAVPAGLKDWALPVDQLGEGTQYYKFDPARAKKLLAEAGYPNGFQATISYATYGSTIQVDAVQLLLKYMKDIGIEAKPIQQEYGAYISTTFYGKYESMAYGPQTPFLDPDNFLFGPHMPGELKNQSHVNDPVLGDMLIRQRRTADVAKRRELLHEIQRYLAKQQYYVYAPSGVNIGVWDGALKNYAPNIGYDWGGRVTAAWLDR
jgi:peptide/nickel transport system substrate-binding protein